MEPTAPVSVPRHPKFVRWALMLGIVVILNIFFNVLVSLALPEPDYTAFCPVSNMEPQPTDANSCDSAGGVWMDTSADAPASADQATMPMGYCQCANANLDAYQAASDHHDLYSFVFMIALGVLALLGGLIPIGSSIVSSGLSYGGVLALIVGSAKYWDSAGGWLQLLIAAAGLIALLYIGIRRFKD